ncbi:hypothetical protein BDV06DRAFT_235322 [Aspergillus oleicola]
MARPGPTHPKRRKSERTQSTTRKKSKIVSQPFVHDDEVKKDERVNPFQLMPESFLPFQPTAITIEEAGIDTAPPNNVPPLPTHGPCKTKVGIMLGNAGFKKSTDVSAYACVDACGRYTITDSKDTPLEDGQYRMDPAYDTKAKLLRLVLEIVEGFAKTLNADCVRFRSDLDSYFSKRRAWEVNLVKQLAKGDHITISDEDMLDIELWRSAHDGEPETEENFQWYLSTFAPSHAISGHEWISFIQIDDVHDAVRSLARDIQRLQVSEEPEQLLIKFDDDGKACPRQQVQPHFIPPPPRGDAESFYHWCLERHGRWARERAFHSFSCHQVHQLASLDDIMSKDHVDLPGGNHGLIWQLMGRTEPDLEKYPWGLPAHKLYETMRSSDLGDQYYTIPARDFLIDLEQWYFNKPNKAKKDLQNIELMAWSLKDKKVVDKRAKLLELPNYASVE